MSRQSVLAVDKVGSQLIWFAPDGLQQRTMSMPSSPHELVLSPTGKTAYISIYGSGTYASNPHPGTEIQVIDLLTGIAQSPLSTLPYTSPHGLTLDRDGLLWVTCDRHGVLLALSVEEKQITGVVETGSVGTHWVIASADRSRLYTSNKQDSFISIVDPKRMRLEGQISVPHGSEGICLSPDGRWLYAADHQRPVVLKIDTRLEKIVDEIVLQGFTIDASSASHHMRVRVSPDGRSLCASAYHHDRLLLIDTTETSRQSILKTGAGPMALAFHPQQPGLLYLSNHDAGSVSIVDVEAAQILQTFPCGSGVESMEFVVSA